MEIGQHVHKGRNPIFLPYMTCTLCEKNSLKNDRMVIKYKRCVYCGNKLVDKKSMRFIEKLARVRAAMEKRDGNN